MNDMIQLAFTAACMKAVADQKITTADAQDIFAAEVRHVLSHQLDDDDIRALRADAGGVGDPDMVALCDLALDGDIDAREDVAVWIFEMHG